MPLSHKIATIIAFLAIVVCLLPEVKPGLLTFDPTYPAIAVFTGCEAAVYWKERRLLACLLLFGAIVSAASFFLEFSLL